MSVDEQEALEAIQREATGSQAGEPLVASGTMDTIMSAGDWVDVDEDNVPDDPSNEDYLNDAAIIEDLGIVSDNKASEWGIRLKNEHNAWMEQLPALCDAYLLFRSQAARAASQPGPDTGTECRTITAQCIDLYGALI